jgi:nickel-dependent lactate racemase
MTILDRRGGPDEVIDDGALGAALHDALRALGRRRRVLAIPPDFTRAASRAGELTCHAHRFYGEALTDVLPALGTHVPMADWQLDRMYPQIPRERFRVHDWRNDVATIGEIAADQVARVTDGICHRPWPCQLNRLVWEGGHDLVLSIGQVVPHEVVGMANYTKNLFVGAGGAAGINESHFIGAAYGMERMMGRADTPVRRLLNQGLDRFCAHLPVVFVLTVVAREVPSGRLVTRGLFVGDHHDCFDAAAELSQEVNVELLDEVPDKVVCWLDPEEFHSTWLGNKSIYRTRMAIADGGELVVLAPGVSGFGEDPAIDALIRRYGYRSTPEVMGFVEDHQDLAGNLSAAAHLIHGSSEGRFRVTYCPGGLTREEIESVGFDYGDLDTMRRRYDPDRLVDGWNDVDGERVFYVSNPALGLWANRRRFATT